MKIIKNTVEFKIDYLTLKFYPYNEKRNLIEFGVFRDYTEDITKFFCEPGIDTNIITDVELGDIILKCKEFTSVFMYNCIFADGISRQDIDAIICKELPTNNKVSSVTTSGDGFVNYAYIECILKEGKIVTNHPFESTIDNVNKSIKLYTEAQNDFFAMHGMISESTSNPFFHAFAINSANNNSEKY